MSGARKIDGTLFGAPVAAPTLGEMREARTDTPQDGANWMWFPDAKGAPPMLVCYDAAADTVSVHRSAWSLARFLENFGPCVFSPAASTERDDFRGAAGAVREACGAGAPSLLAPAALLVCAACLWAAALMATPEEREIREVRPLPQVEERPAPPAPAGTRLLFA